MASLTASRALAPIGTAGNLFAFGLDVGRGIFRRPFQLREFIQQAWFIASVTIVPTALVAIPFGAVIALQVGGLIQQFGAQSFTGSASVLAVVREAGPIVTSLLIAGAGGSAIAVRSGHLPRWSHACREASYRATGAWGDFSDWLRVGR